MFATDSVLKDLSFDGQLSEQAERLGIHFQLRCWSMVSEMEALGAG